MSFHRHYPWNSFVWPRIVLGCRCSWDYFQTFIPDDIPTQGSYWPIDSSSPLLWSMRFTSSPIDSSPSRHLRFKWQTIANHEISLTHFLTSHVLFWSTWPPLVSFWAGVLSQGWWQCLDMAWMEDEWETSNGFIIIYQAYPSISPPARWGLLDF